MGRSWNPDWAQQIIEYLEPSLGTILPEYLENDDGSIMLEQKEGNPNYLNFVDGSTLARMDFSLYVRCNGRASADRKRATDLLYEAANLCEAESPVDDSYIVLTAAPSLFNRNMSGFEEYRASFALYCKIPKEEAQ